MVDRLPKNKKMTPLAVPFSIRIFKKCVDYSIDFNLVRHLHLYDLQCLLMQYDTQRVLDYFDSEEKRSLQSRGISSVKDIDGSEALKFLRGGRS